MHALHFHNVDASHHAHPIVLASYIIMYPPKLCLQQVAQSQQSQKSNQENVKSPCSRQVWSEVPLEHLDVDEF
jgi:hypothetical protein